MAVVVVVVVVVAAWERKSVPRSSLRRTPDRQWPCPPAWHWPPGRRSTAWTWWSRAACSCATCTRRWRWWRRGAWGRGARWHRRGHWSWLAPVACRWRRTRGARGTAVCKHTNTQVSHTVQVTFIYSHVYSCNASRCSAFSIPHSHNPTLALWGLMSCPRTLQNAHRGAGDRTTDSSVSGWPTLPPESPQSISPQYFNFYFALANICPLPKGSSLVLSCSQTWGLIFTRYIARSCTIHLPI